MESEMNVGKYLRGEDRHVGTSRIESRLNQKEGAIEAPTQLTPSELAKMIEQGVDVKLAAPKSPCPCAKLSANKLGAHWMEVAAGMMAAGDSEETVMAQYGYVKAAPSQEPASLYSVAEYERLLGDAAAQIAECNAFWGRKFDEDHAEIHRLHEQITKLEAENAELRAENKLLKGFETVMTQNRDATALQFVELSNEVTQLRECNKNQAELNDLATGYANQLNVQNTKLTAAARMALSAVPADHPNIKEICTALRDALGEVK